MGPVICNPASSKTSANRTHSHAAPIAVANHLYGFGKGERSERPSTLIVDKGEAEKRGKSNPVHNDDGRAEYSKKGEKAPLPAQLPTFGSSAQ